MKTFEDFRKAMAMRESSGNYGCVNSLGYLGAYQFGKPRLYDLGISIDGWQPKGQEGRKTTVLSTSEFLGNVQLQDECFSRHVDMLANYFKKRIAPESIQKWTLSGLIAGAHLKGIGGVLDFLKGNDNADAYGTKISEYINLFAGYDIG